MITDKIKSRLEELRAAGAAWVHRIQEHERQATELYIAMARDEAVLKELESLLAEIEDSSSPKQPTEIPTPSPPRYDYEAERQRVYELLNEGFGMKEIAAELGIKYNRVATLRAHWERETGKDYYKTCKFYLAAEAVQKNDIETCDDDPDLPEPSGDLPRNGDGDSLQDRTECRPQLTKPPETSISLDTHTVSSDERSVDRRGCNTVYSAAELQKFRERIEAFIRKNGPQAYSRILAGAGLSPHQFNAALPDCDIQKTDGLWHFKLRIESND